MPCIRYRLTVYPLKNTIFFKSSFKVQNKLPCLIEINKTLTQLKKNPVGIKMRNGKCYALISNDM